MNKLLLILTAGLFLLSTTSTLAQIDLQNTGTLYISGGSDILFINGNFTNTSAAALTNNGSLYIKKDLTNDQSSMAIGTGTLYLNGTLAQSTNGTQLFKTYNFISDNTAGITLNTDFSISGAHTYTNGLIASSANYLMYEAGSSYTGATDARHATGWVKKMGNTNFTFPVGDATYLRSAGIINLTAASEFNCHYYKPTANVFNLASPLIQVNSREYWQMDEISGNNAQIVLNWDNSKVAFDMVLVNEIRVGVYSAGKWRSAGGTATGNVTTTGSVTSFIGNAFAGPMTFGYAADFVLPLKIINFSAERKTGISYLRWTTEDEKDIDRYEIQRSSDGSNFATISSIKGRNSGQQEIYNYEDLLPVQGVVYYRIKAIDINGKSVYTKIAAVSETNISTNLFKVVNPSGNIITVINKSGTDGVFDYRLLNAAGQLVVRGNISMSSNGAGIINVPEQSTSGMYILEIGNSHIQFKQKIIIQK